MPAQGDDKFGPRRLDHPTIVGEGRAAEALGARPGDPLVAVGDPDDVASEIAQDAQPGLEGDVAEGALPGAAAAVLLADLGVVELGDGVMQRSGNGCDST